MIHLLCAFCLVGWLCCFLRCRVERALPLMVGLGMLLLVPLAMARALWMADLLSAAVVLGTLLALLARRRRLTRDAVRAFSRRVLTPGALVFALLCAGLFFATRSRAVWEWDEYSYWALKTKELWYTGGVQTGLCSLTPRFGDYQIGAQALEWAWLRVLGRWDEGGLYFVLILSNLVYLLPLAERIRWKQCWLALPCLLAMIALPAALSSNIYVSLGVDTLLGMQAGFLLFTLQEERSRLTDVSAVLTLCALTLTKQIGLAWGAAALLFSVATARPKRSALIRSLSLLALPAVCFVGWKIYCSANGLSNYLSATARVSLASFHDLSWLVPTGYKTFLLKTAKAFWLAPVSGCTFAAPELQAPLGFSIGGLLTLCCGGALLRRKPKEALCWGIAAVAALLAFCFSFLTLFREEIQLHADDPLRIPASLERYCCPLVLGGGVYYALRLSRQTWEPKRGPALVLAAAVLLGVCANHQRIGEFLIPSIYAQKHPTADAAERTHEPWMDGIKDPYHSRVLLSGCGYSQYYAYALAPAPVVETLGWTEADDAEDLARFLRQDEITHVMLFGDWGRTNAAAQRLIRQSGFEPKIGTLYAVEGETWRPVAPLNAPA